MKILQTADNHLGETAYSRIDPSTGLNARGLDFLDSFQNILEVASKERVDVLLVVGDFFTRVNPHPRYLLEVMKDLKKLSKANVVTIFVSGNHETPKMVTTVNPLSLLGQMDNVYVVLEPTSIEIDGIDFVCVPAPPVFDEIKDLFTPLLQKALKDSKSERKILAAHLPLGQAIISSERTLESFIGECVDIKQIPNKFMYTALGHMHRFQQLDQEGMPVIYSGSSERYQWGEEHDDKFAVLIDIEDKVETLNVAATMAGEVRPIHYFSEGQKTRINMALRVAISRILSKLPQTEEHAYAIMQTLFIDEGDFGSLDESGIRDAVSIIRNLTKEFDRVILISHVPTIREIFQGYVLEVVKTRPEESVVKTFGALPE